MNHRSESEILSEVVENTRSLARYYLSKLKGSDMHKIFEADGKKLNTAHWILCHLTWAENYLLLKGTGGNTLAIDWLDDYKIGSKPENIKHIPTIEEAFESFHKVHAESMAHIKSLSGDSLLEPNNIQLSFGGDASKKMVIHHHIRHEGSHIGHLTWLVKLYGVEAP